MLHLFVMSLFPSLIWNSSSLPLSWLYFLKNIGQLFFRKFFQFGFMWCHLIIGLRLPYPFLLSVRSTTEVILFPSHCIISISGGTWYCFVPILMMLICNTWSWWCMSEFTTIFPFVNDTYFLGRYFETENILVLIKVLANSFNTVLSFC